MAAEIKNVAVLSPTLNWQSLPVEGDAAGLRAVAIASLIQASPGDAGQSRKARSPGFATSTLRRGVGAQAGGLGLGIHSTW